MKAHCIIYFNTSLYFGHKTEKMAVKEKEVYIYGDFITEKER
jgi:hypothetical protein